MPVDEGTHRFTRREWWYFNVIFDDPHSELINWSMIVSFNKMAGNDIRYLQRDNLFVILYDEMRTSYDFSIIDKPRKTLQMGGPGVDIQFEDSWAQGQYPSWQIHTSNKEKGFTVDLNFTADFLPVWVIGRSTNLLFGKYFGGDYYIPRCVVNGTIQWQNKEYKVSGIGYHDHIWETFVPRIITSGWEWFSIHFDNGWEMYLSKFDLRTLKDRYAAAIIISPNNRNLVEYDKFAFTYTQTAQAQEIPSIVYPKKCRLEAERDGIVLTLDIEIYNTYELAWKMSRTAMFEGPCRVIGTMSWSGNTVALNGLGMSEITRVKYLLELPHILR
jgi:predicted secreted hydrolase